MKFVVPVKASTLYRLIEETGGRLLNASGFDRVGPRTWVRSTKVPIRELIYFRPPHSYLGATPVWAFSLDYVPDAHHTNNFEVRWHARAERVVFDLGYDPLEYDWNGRPRWSIPTDEGPGCARERAAAVVRLTLESALRSFFDPVGTVADLPTAFEAKLRRAPWAKHGRPPWGAFMPQEQLAYAFTLARLGRPDEGRVWLERFTGGDRLMPRVTRRHIGELYDLASGGG
ncbi:MAG: hypothetical protein JWO31_960 [Phycisphaerales bacterium]|nr:hypothetical protein [Phycisphaerales bacterium]